MTTDSLYVHSSDLPWRESPFPGVQWKKLRYDQESGNSAIFLRFAPGSSYGLHRHPGGEEYLVLEGSVVDGGRSYGRGSYVCHPPGSVHQPRSPEGCLLFVRLEEPIELES